MKCVRYYKVRRNFQQVLYLLVIAGNFLQEWRYIDPTEIKNLNYLKKNSDKRRYFKTVSKQI